MIFNLRIIFELKSGPFIINLFLVPMQLTKNLPPLKSYQELSDLQEQTILSSNGLSVTS